MKFVESVVLIKTTKFNAVLASEVIEDTKRICKEMRMSSVACKTMTPKELRKHAAELLKEADRREVAARKAKGKKA